MKKPKCIFIMSVISTAIIFLNAVLIIMTMFFPQLAVYILNLESLYEYYDYKLRYNEDELSILILYAASFVPIFCTMLMHCDKKKDYSKKRGVVYLVFSGIFFVISYFSKIYCEYKAFSYNEPLLGDNFVIINFMFIIPLTAIIIFSCACAIEIFICAEEIYTPPEQKKGLHSVTKTMIALLLIVLGFYACLGISYWITGVLN